MFLITFILFFPHSLVFLHKEEKGCPTIRTFRKSEDTETEISPTGELQREGTLLGLPKPAESN